MIKGNMSNTISFFSIRINFWNKKLFCAKNYGCTTRKNSANIYIVIRKGYVKNIESITEPQFPAAKENMA
jgi:hypothetical protein